jgi:hypothetical protein
MTDSTPVTVIAAEHVGWDTYVLVYSNGIRQQCSCDTFHNERERLARA